VLAVPIFDTTLVTVVRWLHGRPLSQGGRDHTAHRLVALGLSERGVALSLYGCSGALALTALAAADLPPLALLALAALVLHGVGLLGVFLGMVQVYEASPGTQLPARAALGTLLQAQLIGKKALARVMLDVFFVPLALIVSLLLRYDAAIPAPLMDRIVAFLPLAIALKTAVMVACRTHTGLWSSAGVEDVLATLKGSSIASTGIFLAASLLGFRELPRSVFILDWLLFTALALSVRVGLVLLKTAVSGWQPAVGSERRAAALTRDG
jgi:UDP-GlcNAc:undecaprenyl-phosphate GlcNAc-1-phosphate transferase